MRWRIYYDDGSTFSDRDGEPFAAPPAGVQVIAQEADNPSGRVLTHGKDYYWWNPREACWYGGDLGGLWDYLLIGTGPKYVVAGRSVDDPVWQAILLRAVNEGLGDER